MFSKKERHDLYKKALNKIHNRSEDFICVALETSTKKMVFEGDFNHTLNKDFKEVYTMSTPGWNDELSFFVFDNQYDLTPENRRVIRENILLFCIEMTKPE